MAIVTDLAALAAAADGLIAAGVAEVAVAAREGHWAGRVVEFDDVGGRSGLAVNVRTYV